MESNVTHHILARNFTLLSEKELLMILDRRNHPDVRKCMVHTNPIATEEHLRYCASLKERSDILQLLVEFDGIPACVLTFKATDDSWQEIADCGIYAFDPEPCSSSILSNIIGCQLIANRGVKVSSLKVRNDNEMAIFANQYYHDFHVVRKDAEYTYMTAKLAQPSKFYQARVDHQLTKLHAQLELIL